MDAIKVIGFDADDTLWVSGSHFRRVEKLFCSLMSSYMSEEELSDTLFCVEKKNMNWYGYGAMAYTLSLIETALAVSKNTVPASVITEILELGKSLLNMPVELFPGVMEVLPRLQPQYRLIVVTKGDLLDQERKLKKSGLLPYFLHIEVVSEKTESSYLRLVRSLDISPEHFLMVGNSIKSDIIPVLAIGGKAVHVPFSDVWQLEHAEKPSGSYCEIQSLTHLPDILHL
jgi:putative hydrolase of the HAD superfamily